MAINLFLTVFWIWVWIKLVITRTFPFMDRVNQFLLGLLLGLLTQVLLYLAYLNIFVRVN